MLSRGGEREVKKTTTMNCNRGRLRHRVAGGKEGRGRPVVIVVFEAVKNDDVGEVALLLSSRGVGQDLGEKGVMGATSEGGRGGGHADVVIFFWSIGLGCQTPPFPRAC